MKGVTPYQLEALQHIAAGAPSAPERLIDFDQLLDSLSWMPTKQSAQFIIRALVTKGLITKFGTEMRRGRHRVCYQATTEGMKVLDPRVAVVSSVRTDPLSALSEPVPELPVV
jgi:DNA-binding PadR family transcriptional regulator